MVTRIADVLVGFLRIPFRSSAVSQMLVCCLQGDCNVWAALADGDVGVPGGLPYFSTSLPLNVVCHWLRQ